MTKDEFLRLLKQGAGRAVLFLQDHEDAPYRDLILYACTHNLAYDSQCEDRCPEYFLDLIAATKDASYYRDRLLASLLAPLEDEDEIQMFEIARLLAERGDKGARSAMYSAFARTATAENWYCTEDLILLDGLPALLFVTGPLAALDTKEEASLIDSWIEIVEKRLGKADAWREMEREAAQNPVLASWLEAARTWRIERRQDRSDKRKRPPITYAEIKQLIENNSGRQPRYVLGKWGQKADAEALAQAASDLLAEIEPERLLCYLYIFARTPFPAEPQKIIALAEHQDERMVWAALKAAENITHSAVREFALESIAAKQHFDFVVKMLTNNYRAGDEAIVCDLVNTPLEHFDHHRMGIDARDFCKTHPGERAVHILTRLYRNSFCSLCRYDVVEQLIALNAVPDWMREECRYDAEADIRTMASKL